MKKHWIQPSLFSSFLSRRPLDSHKGENGHLLLVGGTPNRLGAILLAARAALRGGAGLVTVALPDRAYQKIPKGLLEVMYEPMRKPLLREVRRFLSGKDATAVGPGLGVSPDTRSLVKGLLKGLLPRATAMVLDADALNGLAGRADLLKKANGPLILTPHPGEFARLIGFTTKKVESDRVGLARDFARTYHVILVLKGFRTVVATPTGEYYVNPTGNPAMATAGMGDVLTGLIGSFLVQGSAGDLGSPLEATLAAVYLHGLAGDRVMERLGDRGMLASDLIEEIPLVLKGLVS